MFLSSSSSSLLLLLCTFVIHSIFVVGCEAVFFSFLAYSVNLVSVFMSIQIWLSLWAFVYGVFRLTHLGVPDHRFIVCFDGWISQWTSVTFGKTDSLIDIRIFPRLVSSSLYWSCLLICRLSANTFKFVLFMILTLWKFTSLELYIYIYIYSTFYSHST